MEGLFDLEGATPQEWDSAIATELGLAGIEIKKFREYDTPHSWAKHTLQGKLGDWFFSRERGSYSFCGDVPLATAEVIATDPVCLAGCVPKQWLHSWGKRPVPSEVHPHYTENIVWIDQDGLIRVLEEGLPDRIKEVHQHDSDHKLLFVADPAAEGKPYIRAYTFFTLEALQKFIEITKRHRVNYKIH